MMTESDRELKEIINSRFDRLSKEVTEVKTEIKIVKNDLTWIKWLFGILGSLIIVLLRIYL
jgi:hypothetical protein